MPTFLWLFLYCINFHIFLLNIYDGFVYRSINGFFSMVTSRDCSCDMPQMDQGFEIKLLTGKGGICNAKNGTHQRENFLDRMKHKGIETALPILFWVAEESLDLSVPSKEITLAQVQKNIPVCSRLCVSPLPCLLQWPPTALHGKYDVIDTEKKENLPPWFKETLRSQVDNSYIIFSIISVLLWDQRTLIRLVPPGQNCSNTDKRSSSSSIKQALSSLIAWMLYIQNYLFITFLIWMLKWYLPFLKQHLSVLVKSFYFWNYLPCARSHTVGNDSWAFTQVPVFCHYTSFAFFSLKLLLIGELLNIFKISVQWQVNFETISNTYLMSERECKFDWI